MYDKIDKAIEKMADRVAANADNLEAMQYSQAAWNLANAKATLASIDQALKTTGKKASGS